MTSLQICGMVNDSSTHIRQKQYEMPNDLPDDLATIDVEGFAELSDNNTTPLARPTPTVIRNEIKQTVFRNSQFLP